MTSDDEQLLRRRMSRLSDTARLNGRTMIPILAQAIREVARNNDAVGRQLLAVAIPRKSVRPGQFMLTSSTGNEDNPTFLYLPDGNVIGEHYAPAVTVGGLQISGVRYGPAGRDGRVHL